MTVVARRILFAVSVVASFVVSDALAKGPFGTIKVGNWAGGAWTNDATGAFSHCSAGAPYLSGIYFMVALDVSGGWTLGFAHQSWQLRPNEAFPIDLTFDGQTQFHVFGAALTNNFVRVPMPINSALMAQFRKSAMMTALAKGGSSFNSSLIQRLNFFPRSPIASLPSRRMASRTPAISA